MREIKKIAYKGVARACHLKRGDIIHSFNGRKLNDILDYIYADSLEDIAIRVERNGRLFDCNIKKCADASMGISFNNAELQPKKCKNNCIFCFVDQLPKGLRDSLYVKDDDYRLSFSMGNYITLTGIGAEDWQRILDYKLSPLYVSVHTTEHNLRLNMLGVKKAPNIINQLKELIAHNIKVHTQIVLVKGYNDGKQLEKTLQDLFDLSDNILSVAIVPVGLTAYRQGLTRLQPLQKEDAKIAIALAHKFYKKRKYFCYCSDEMYHIAQEKLPEFDYYGAFEQIENGVGLRAKFLQEVDCAIQQAQPRKKRNVGIVTSVGGEKDIIDACKIIKTYWQEFSYNIYPVRNIFFGPTITVAGLLTYTDIVATFTTPPANDFLVLPSVMLREATTTFLDGKTVKDLADTLQKKIIVSGNTGAAFVDTLIYAK